jgi:hypothetical protein
MDPNREKLLNFVKTNGPLLPVQVSKYLNTDIIFAGAMLSELVAHNHVFVTNTKKGGSPFYYTKGQEPKLSQLGVYLHGKEKEVFDLIIQKKIIRDEEALPWQRVALRAIKDFAVPIEVEFKGNREIFWKWYLSNDQEVNELVSKILDTIPEEEQEIIPPQEILEEAPAKYIPIKEELPIIEEPKIIIEKQEILVEEEKPIKEKKSPIIKKRKKDHISNFSEELQKYIKHLSIEIIEQSIIRPEKEIDYIVKVPSNIGEIHFYMKAKNKSSINDSDLALAYSTGQQKNLQTLFISDGSLTKKGKEYIDKHLRGQLTFISLNKEQ